MCRERVELLTTVLGGVDPCRYLLVGEPDLGLLSVGILRIIPLAPNSCIIWPNFSIVERGTVVQQTFAECRSTPPRHRHRC
jgi:hypothetical protein